MDLEQRLTLHKLVMKSELKTHHHDWLFYRKLKEKFDFKEDMDALNSLAGDFYEVDWYFEVEEETFPAICLKKMTKLDLSIFEELRKIAKYDEDLVREIIVSLDFKCIAY